MNTALKVVKIVGGLVISVGIGTVAVNLIKATTPADTKRLTKICIAVGSFCISGIAAGAASNQFEATIDQITNAINVWSGNEESEKTIKEEA